MDHQMAVSALEKILPTINEKVSPKDAIIKYATAHNLAHAQVEYLAKTFNIAKTLNFMSKSANRGATFPILDPMDILADYTTFKPEQKSAYTSEPRVVWDDRDAEDWIKALEMDKAASVKEHNPFRVPNFRAKIMESEVETEKFTFSNEEIEKIAARRAEEDFKDLDRELAMTDNLLLEKKAALEDGLDDFVQKFAYVNKPSFATLEEDAFFENDVNEFMPEIVKRASGFKIKLERSANMVKNALRKVYKDRTGLFPELKKLVAVKEDINALAGYAEEICKKAGLAAAPAGTYTRPPLTVGGGGGKPPQQGRRDDGLGLASLITAPIKGLHGMANKRDLTTNEAMSGVLWKPLEWAANKGDSLLGQAVRKGGEIGGQLMGLGTHGISNMLSKLPGMDRKNFGSNPEQDKIQKSLHDLEDSTTLQRLMMKDQIIGEADPHSVVELYHSLRSMNPTLASDPSLLRFALRDAVQYGAIPTHTYTELVDANKKIEETANTRKNLGKDYNKI
jgi:hypothetical protein